jgi:hypothetical protein
MELSEQRKAIWLEKKAKMSWIQIESRKRSTEFIHSRRCQIPYETIDSNNWSYNYNGSKRKRWRKRRASYGSPLWMRGLEGGTASRAQRQRQRGDTAHRLAAASPAAPAGGGRPGREMMLSWRRRRSRFPDLEAMRA